MGLFLVDWGRFRARNGIWFISLFSEVVAATEVTIFEFTIPLRLGLSPSVVSACALNRCG